jgi:hypothetical protein
MNKKRNRNARCSDSPPEDVTKKLKEKQSSPLSCDQNYEQNNPDSEIEQDSNEISNPDIDNPADTMEEVFDRMLRESEKRVLRSIKEEMSDTVREEISQLREDLQPVMELANRMAKLEEKLTKVASQADWRDKDSRKCNIIVHGMTDKEKETYQDRELVIRKLSTLLKVTAIDFSEARRLGKFNDRKPRPLLIKMVRYRDKADLQSRWKNLQGSGVSLSDDLTQEERKAKSILISKQKEIRTRHSSAKCTIRNGSLQVWIGDQQTTYIVNTSSWTAEERNSSHSSQQHSRHLTQMDQ